MTSRFLILLAFLAHLAPAILADEPASEPAQTALLREEADLNSEFIVNTWRAGEGLPANEIQSLRETPDGYLWLGTHQGLVRFDGVKFQTFFSAPTGLRYGTRIGPLELDTRGRLWLAPDQVGLIYRESGAFTEIHTNDSVLRARVENLCSDGTNWMMWVDANGKLGRSSLENPRNAEAINGGGANGVSRWHRGYDGQLWLVNSRNLKIRKQDAWRDVQVPGNASMIATPRRAGGLWIAREARLWLVTGESAPRAKATFPWKGQSRVHCMLEDTHGRLWIGTVGQGLYCYSAGEFKQVVSTASSINCLFQDSQDNIWVGTRGSGLLRVRERQFFMHDLNSGLQNEYVRSLSQDDSGRVWVLTAEGGLGWWLNGAWHQLSEADGWGRFDSLCVVPAKAGGVWISTSRRGLWRWQNGKFTRQLLGPKGPKEPPMDLLEDRRGRLWMVTDNSGVYCLETNTVTGYGTQEGLPSTLARRLIEDEAGNIWVGDWEGGIARFREHDWELVRTPSGHADAVRCMAVTDDTIWIGSSAGGLLRFKDGQTTRVSVDQGLPDASIRQLLLDGQGSLWAGTPHQLFRVSLSQLNDVMDGRAQKIEPVRYGHSDGLPDVSFASWCDPRSWRTTEGELWFATANGAIYFQPGKLRMGKPPETMIEQTLLNGKPVGRERLRPGVSRLEFQFTAPCLTAPERVRFRYQLTGVDSDWVEAGTARTATYGSIPPGDHVFQVLASSPEGVWGVLPAKVSLSVHPYFWQTTWFITSITAALAGGAVWLVRLATVRRLRYRLAEVSRQHAMDRERTRIAQDIHDELGASLTRIGLLADLGTRHKTDPPSVARDLGEISKTARESVAAMDAIVWALNPRNDSLDNFANYVAQYTREFFQPTTLRTRLDLPVNLPAHRLAAETRHELFLLVKESFNNIVRHANATEVHVSLACDNGDLRLVIADNGKGLPAEPSTSDSVVGHGKECFPIDSFRRLQIKTLPGAPAGRNGLVNLNARIERLGGTLRIESKTGAGVRLDFGLPLAKLKPS